MKGVILCAAALLGLGGGARADDGRLAVADDGIAAIAMYPEGLRDALLEVATEPALVVRIARLQRASSAEFEALVEAYPRYKQQAIWDLVRFPELVEALVAGGVKTKPQIRALLADYPKSVHAKALKYGREEYDLLVEIRDLNRATQEEFAALSADYPAAVRAGAEALVGYPEVLALLGEDAELTVLLGEAYAADPAAVRGALAARHLQLARERTEALRQEAEGLDPEQADEFKAIARAYDARYGYDTRGFDGPEDDGGVEVDVRYYGSPYPYWFGYPRWYGAPHAALNWYITPRVRASVAFGPRWYYPHRPVKYYRGGWSPYYGHKKMVRTYKSQPAKKRVGKYDRKRRSRWR